jgi:fibronectin type III domain protein
VVLKVRPGFLVPLLAALCAAIGPATAGSIALTWDPTAGATGYHVYYGTQSGIYLPTPVTTTSTSATISGLQDCTTYFVAVKAFNASGESPNFSNELSGWSRPSVTAATPSSALQGAQIVMDITGTNFQSGAVVDLGNPNVVLTSVQVLSCSHIQLLATVEPTSSGIRPAPVGRLDVTVQNPDSVFGMKTQAFEVLLNPARFDINQSDATTRNRIDGKDTVYLSRQFGVNEADPNYDPDDDFDGNGWIDGQDLAYIASNLGKCWSSTLKSWSVTACPTSLQ